MPELPEVQTIVNDLNKEIKGEIITSFWSDWRKGIKGDLRLFKKEIKGRKIISAERIGKNILLGLSKGATVIIHLRMTGALLVKNKMFNAKRDKHIHHIFYFKSGKALVFKDIRKFGNLELIGTGMAAKISSLKRLGIDVLSKNFTFPEFSRILENKKTNIKQLLMDQSKIAGIGNIYANEILYEAGIHPQRGAHELKQGEIRALYVAIKKVIKKAIKFRGTSVSDYRDANGEHGKFQKMLRVYQKTGQKCGKCGTIIKRSIVGQRSTFHCPKCQK